MQADLVTWFSLYHGEGSVQEWVETSIPWTNWQASYTHTITFLIAHSPSYREFLTQLKHIPAIWSV